MAKELIINASLPEVRIALMEDGRIQELLIERESDKGIVGNIYKGRVTRVLPGMQAAFVDVGLDKAAFLYVDDIYVHPKVMGEETEVEEHYDDEGEETGSGAEEVESREQREPREPREAKAPVPRPEGSFVSRPRPVITPVIRNTEEVSEDLSPEGVSAEGLNEGTTEDALQAAPADAEAVRAGTVDHDRHEEVESAEAHAEHANRGADSSTEEEFDEEEEQDDATAAFEAAHDLEEEENEAGEESGDESFDESEEESTENADENADQTGGLENLSQPQGKRNSRGRNRNRKRGRNRKGSEGNNRNQFAGGETDGENDLPENFNESVNDGGQVSSDRAQMEGEGGTSAQKSVTKKVRSEFKEPRARDRRIKSKHTRPRAQANIADLLKEGQEVIVQIAKDPIATKGARLTCHVSLPGRHLVCMPSIDHVGVSRRIERDDERRRLRDFVERNRPRKMGFIVRTASGGKDPESWIKQDIDYLSKLWGGIRAKADDVSAPALVYEDLNSILRAIRDWVNEDIDKIIVDSRYHYNELQAFADRFMPALHEKLELYHGDVPIFDAYGISSELHRSLERKVWLKSGGYLVIDQAEALVAIDVNTGRYVGKKSLEDTILKTNIEAAEEIAHQLRLRNCGGIIICDFIDMERDDNRMRVYRALDEALKKDRARPTIQKISELGLVEMTRKRTRDTIIRTLCEPCTHCEGKGFVKSTLTVAYEILREIERLSVDREAKKVLVSAHETVINALAIELRDALDQIERRYNKTVYLQTVMDFHSEQFEVVTDRAQGKKGAGDIARQLRVERERTERKEKHRSRKNESSGRNDSNDEDSEGSENENVEVRETQSRPEPTRSNHRDRNQKRDQNRDQNRHSNRDQNRDQNKDQNREPVEAKEGDTPAAPVPRPSGSFVTTRAGAPVPSKATITMKPKTQAPAAGEEGASDEDAQPSFNDAQPGYGQEEVQSGNAYQQASSGHEEEINDEDQLAYLRAQAAQDAAIAGMAVNAPNGNRAGQARGSGGRNQNNRNQNNRGGGRNPNQNNRSQNTGQNAAGSTGGGNSRRFKPHHRQPNPNAQAFNGNSVAPVSAATQAPPPVVDHAQVPDYEVISRNDGSDQ